MFHIKTMYCMPYVPGIAMVEHRIFLFGRQIMTVERCPFAVWLFGPTKRIDGRSSCGRKYRII
jgi:hypothetical protein